MRKAGAMRYVGLGRRGVAWLIDWLIMSIPIASLGEYRTGGGAYEVSWQGWRFVVAFVLAPLVYLVLFEWLLAATPGKFTVGIRVRRMDGKRIGFGQSLGRNLARVIDGFPYLIPYVVGAVAVRRSSSRQRLGDRWAGTVVLLWGTENADGEVANAIPTPLSDLPPAPPGRPSHEGLPAPPAGIADGPSAFPAPPSD